MTNEEAVKIIKMAIKALEQRPCEDCISRKDLLKRFKEECATDCSCCLYARDNDKIVGFGYREWCGLIEDAPSVTPTYDLEEYSTKLWKLAYERGKAESEDKE